MALRPVKVLPDLQTQKQIVKIDSFNNLLFNVSGTLNNGHVSSSLPITGSDSVFINLNTSTSTAFNNVNIITSSYETYKTYNIDQAFHAVDNAINASVASSNAYKRLRFQQVGNFDINGNADIELPLTQLAGAAFPVSSLEYVNVSVMIKENNSWYNDILSINITSSGGKIHVILDAPALNNANQYRLIAVNENPNDYIV